MRKLLSIFFAIILSPTFTMADCNLNSESTGCISYNGCEFKDEGFSGKFCQACYAYEFNNSTENSTSCKSCETDYDFDTMNTGKQWDSTDDSRGNSECPWICTDNWYKSGDSCVHCPTGATSPAGSTAPTQCQCEQNKYLTQNNGEYICKSCPQHSFTYNSGSTSITDCQCEAQYYMGGANDNQCISCPEHGNCAYAGRTYLTATCANNYQKNIDTINHTFSCDDCSDSNATFDGTICKCNANYYGEPNGLDTTCTACPAGTTGAAGATAKSACHMTQNTKFCDANGKCMKLLQNATNINQ